MIFLRWSSSVTSVGHNIKMTIILKSLSAQGGWKFKYDCSYRIYRNTATFQSIKPWARQNKSIQKMGGIRQIRLINYIMLLVVSGEGQNVVVMCQLLLVWWGAIFSCILLFIFYRQNNFFIQKNDNLIYIMKEIEVYDVAVIEKILSKKNRCRYSHYSQIYMTSISEITKEMFS